MHKRLLSFIFSVFAMLLIACDTDNSAKPAPSYLHIDNVGLYPGPCPGINPTSISGVAVYAGKRGSSVPLLGIWALPADIPILEEDSTIITVHGLVFGNGVRSQLLYYSFFDRADTVIKLKPGQVINYNPVVKYTTGLQLPRPLEEDFESPEMVFEKTDSSKWGITKVGKSSQYSFNDCGQYTGLMTATGKDGSIMEFRSKTYLSLPTNNTDIVIEFDYNTSTELAVRMDVFDGTTPINGNLGDYSLIPTNGAWKKGVMLFSDEVFLNKTRKFKLKFRGFNDNDETEYIAIDNIRLSTFKQ
ncbi:MAG: hypothetical protein V4543_14995 [Bacteroidota bacterium]